MARTRPAADVAQCQKWAHQIRTQRHELGWTQEDLAEKAGMSQEVISMMEHGKARSTAFYLAALYVIEHEGAA